MKLRYHALARDELLEIARYYLNVRPELGRAFESEVDSAINRICDNPLQFAEYRPGIRFCSLDRFPYGIYYRIPDPDTVRILIVKHHRRRPGLGMRRI